MRITESLLLGTKHLKEPVYDAYIEGSLVPVLSTQKYLRGSCRKFCQFISGQHHPWILHRPSNNVIIKDTTPAKHKVFNDDELDFILGYEEIKELSLDMLHELAKNHDRCSFVVKDSVFLKLLNGLAAFTGNFKYSSNVFNHEGSFLRLAQNAIFVISLYKLHTFVFDLYGNKPEGCGISFEILDKQNSISFPKITIGFYLLLSNVYEGVFYVDGKNVIPMNTPDFKNRHRYFKDIIELCHANKVKKNIETAEHTQSVFAEDDDYINYVESKKKAQKELYMGRPKPVPLGDAAPLYMSKTKSAPFRGAGSYIMASKKETRLASKVPYKLNVQSSSAYFRKTKEMVDPEPVVEGMMDDLAYLEKPSWPNTGYSNIVVDEVALPISKVDWATFDPPETCSTGRMNLESNITMPEIDVKVATDIIRKFSAVPEYNPYTKAYTKTATTQNNQYEELD